MRSALLGIVVLLGVVVGGWMVFDAVRRLTTGDYTRIDGHITRPSTSTRKVAIANQNV